MHGKLTLLALVVVSAMALMPVHAQEYMDSIWVHISSADESRDEAGNLQVTLGWEVYIKRYNPRRKTYSDWEKVMSPSDLGLTFRAEVSTDSTFSTVADKKETNELSVIFTGLDFGQHYWWRVVLASPPYPSKWDFAEGVVFKHAAVVTKKRGIFAAYWNFIKRGGKAFMIVQHALLLFGIITWILIWRRLWLANIFPPNKPSLMYRILPVDRIGKTELESERGNIFLREVAKYWSKAMESMSVGPEDFPTKEDFLKADEKVEEEIAKRKWLEVGLPNVEKAIEICKNGVPGIKLPKKPLDYPTVRVFLAALENHRANRNNFYASQEMDRAADNTMIKEVDQLKGWEVTALWAVGSIEPMLGLFGTVVGIRQAFGKIEETVRANPNVQLNIIVPQLAGGIHVALITTIVGLMFGIPMMLVHYYYRGKVDWIFGKWEEIMTNILNQA
ncbi:MAG TPA: MotA/TolQ/ExbB proton channel family protein [candidate division Zixibacteria bacterium]|nr:MotA/TolQ/ExbB proton channel family protein [candidate division Zixibacteria bacterium]